MTTTLYERLAYAFDCDLPLLAILERWNEIGPWQWKEWWKDAWGTYLIATGVVPGARGNLKVLWDDEIERLILNVKLDSEERDAQEQFNSVRQTLLEKLLPAIDAANLTPVDTYE